MLLNQTLFAILAAIAASAAVGVVAFKSPVRSALSLVVNFLVLSVLYFTLKAEMLGIIQIAVYTGAIMVLFLFAIMLLNLRGIRPDLDRPDWKRYLAFGLGLALFGLVFLQVIAPLRGSGSALSSDAYGSPHAVGRTLFTLYVWPFELVSVLLLLGVVGSILLAKRRIH